MLAQTLRYWYFAVLGATFMVFEVLVDLYQPRLMASIVDRGILGVDSGGQPNPDFIVSSGVVMLIITVAGCLCGILSGVFANLFSQKAANRIRKSSFEKIMTFSTAQIGGFTTGGLITRTTSDISQIQLMLAHLARGGVRCCMFLFAGSVALLSLATDFGAVILTAIPVVIAEIVFLLWRTSPLFSNLQSRLDRVNAVIQENITGMKVVKAYAKEEKEKRRFEQAGRELADTEFRTAVVLASLHPVMNIVLNLAVAAIIYTGSAKAEAGAMAPGTIIAGVTYMSQILMSLVMVAIIFQSISRGNASLKRITEIMRQKDDLADGPLAYGPEPGRVTFRNVGFAYPGGNAPVLENISFDLKPGQTLAIIGGTGSGKSTLAALCARFYDASEGVVLIDGQDIRMFRKSDLHARIAMALQKAEIFRGSIRDNIDLAGEATDDEIRRAAHTAQADDFIKEQPEGYMTMLGPSGEGLSGGQKQRLSIARALVKKPAVLILDDATSALDFRTERQLLRALADEMKGVTKIIIAQRISTVMNADTIMVLDGGMISAMGSHNRLLESSDLYRNIYSSQMNTGTAR